MYAASSQIVYIGAYIMQPQTCQIIKTTNGGVNWYVIDTVNSAGAVPSGIYFLNTLTGVLAGGGWFNMFKTTDGGFNWFYTFSAHSTLRKIDFGDSVTGYVAGWLGTVLKTTDKGNSWVELPGNTGLYFHDYHCVDFLNAETGYIAGDNYSNNGDSPVFKTTDGGATMWTRVYLITASPLTGISFCNVNTGYVVSSDGFVWKTTNGGNSYGDWTLVGILPHSLMDVYTINADIAYVLGGSGYIAKTTNGGINWIAQNTGTNQNLYVFSFANKDTAYATGSNSTILKTTNGGVIGINPISSEIPREYNLYQNYPNPFNPVTKIKYDIRPPLTPLLSKEGTGVVLKIYDILGREIETIVNEYLQPGTYEVEWVAVNQPSGVYIYKLETDKFNVSKKMVVLK